MQTLTETMEALLTETARATLAALCAAATADPGIYYRDGIQGVAHLVVLQARRSEAGAQLWVDGILFSNYDDPFELELAEHDIVERLLAED